MPIEIQDDDDKISSWWRWGTLIVMVIGFSILALITTLAYDNAPPIPRRVVDSTGQVIFDQEQISLGQTVFFEKDLMEYGTPWGHGAYLGPDFSASYLHRETLSIHESLAEKIYGKPFDQLTSFEQGSISNETSKILKVNLYNHTTGILTFTEEEIIAYKNQLRFWKEYFVNGPQGLPKDFISDEKDLKALTSFFAWTAWAASTNRPGEDFSYTNNFPYDPIAGNNPSSDAYLWSAISLIFLLSGIGIVLFAFGKFNYLGWGGRVGTKHVHRTELKLPSLTPSQKATGKYFVIVSILFLLQVLVGGGVAHFRVSSSFYGLPLVEIFPFNLLRTWHLQLAIFWVATSWLAGGLFIAPLISGKEPKHQKLGVNLLFSALLIVVLGSLGGELASSKNLLHGDLWFWFGNQGSEYLDLGRFWQYLLIVGFLFWLFLLFIALRPAFKVPKRRELSILFFLAAATIPIFYTPALFYDQHTNYTIIDNWRFWIIHLWVEGFFEVFATVLVAIIFLQMKVIRSTTALRIIYLDAILYLGGGVVGTGHHWYFTGQTNVNMALSACFSALEVVPLTLLTLDAWDFIHVSRNKCEECGHHLADKQLWTIYFLIAVGVWNFVGAGIFGFLINLPIISYFEVGTTLTPNHGHAAFFGVFGMLAIGVMLFCTRAQQEEIIWNRTKKYIKVGFFGLNIGLLLMIVLDLFPAGIIQLWDSMTMGYWHARELQFITKGAFHFLEWIRIIGDLTFIIFGVIPIVIFVFMTFVKKNPRPKVAQIT